MSAALDTACTLSTMACFRKRSMLCSIVLYSNTYTAYRTTTQGKSVIAEDKQALNYQPTNSICGFSWICGTVGLNDKQNGTLTSVIRHSALMAGPRNWFSWKHLSQCYKWTFFGRSTTATNPQKRVSDLAVHVFNQTACDDDDVFRNLGHFFDAHVNHSSERDLKYMISNASVCKWCNKCNN